MASNWLDDKVAADAFMPAVKSIMGRIMLVESTAFEDARENTDLRVLVMRGTRVAVRIRRSECLASQYDRFDRRGEFTIRTSRPSGADTELRKIARGWGDWFFYGFGDYGTGRLVHYVVVDLNVFRHRLIENTPPIKFSDQTDRDGSATFRGYRLESFGSDVVVKQWSEAT